MSTRPHARIVRLELDAVRAAPGVACVLTAEDVPGINDASPVFGDDPIFAEGLVEYAGQSVFAVAAETIDQARAAASLADIAYEDLDVLITVDEAMDAGSFVLPDYTMALGDSVKALEGARHRLSGRFRVGGQDHFYLEGQIALAVPGEDRDVHIYSSTQHPSEVQHNVAKALGVPEHSVTVELRRMGGGFGGKESQPSLMASIAALVAHHTDRPAKVRLDRDDDMILTGKRHDFRIDYDVGFDDEGRIEGIEYLHAVRCGMSADLSGAIADRAMFHADNCYFLGNATIRSHRCKTHTVSNTAFRGFGGPQGMIAMERVIDRIAFELGKDPLEVRKLNFYGGEGRDTTPYHMKVEDFVAGEIVSELEASSDYSARRAATRAFNETSPWLKKGIALTPVKFGISFTTSHLNQAGALVHVYKDGSVYLNHGGTEMGQGLFTKVAQVVAEEFQIDVDRVRITSTTTDKVPNTSATAASSGSDLNGMAARAAAQAIKARLIEHAAEAYNVGADQIEFLPNRVPGGQSGDRFRPARPRGLHGAHLAVFDRLLPHAEDPLGRGSRAWEAVLLFRLWRGRVRGPARHPDRREQGAPCRHPARRRQVAEPRPRPRPDRRRLRPGHGLADDGGTVLGRSGAALHPCALDLQDPGLLRPARRLPHEDLGEGPQRGEDHLPFQGDR